ncbi:MAG TPA: amino acid racemase [Bacteroidales bacterium]|nr:amino acid racemase [Bacteroidales bacterium]
MNQFRPINIKSLLKILILIILAGCSTEKGTEEGKTLLGIFGGMGPEATADLYRQIVQLTPAETDQEHVPTLIYSLPQVPDRMASIRNNDGSIIPFLIEGVTRLERSGASLIAIPCNTVHYFYDEMDEAVSIPIIHMIRETVNEVVKKYPDYKNIGLLATTGTIETKLYENELISKGYNVIIPDDDVESEKVMKAVFGIKAGIDKKINEDLLFEAGSHVIQKGAELIILGCTEIPLAFNSDRVDVPVINATEILALRAIELYNQINESK